MNTPGQSKTHAHRFTMRKGTQVVSSAVKKGSDHRHEVRGAVTGPPVQKSGDHVHFIHMDYIDLESGPSISRSEAVKTMDEYRPALTSARALNKGIMPDLVDPEHSYIFKSGDFGLFDYWYIDRNHNYWKYTNAPEDSTDYEPNLGTAVMHKEQPLPAENPQFFTAEGKKRHLAVPTDLLAERNEAYSPIDPRNIWFEVYEREDDRRYIYLDSDIRENLDLWTQYQLRITDANIPTLRGFAIAKFINPHPKDKLIGAILMLMDQGLYELEELLEAAVEDLEFIDNTVKLLGRKFVCDPEFLDFLTSLVGIRESSAPLFSITSIHGEGKLGVSHVAAILKHLKVSPAYLLSWHASHIYSKVVNRRSFSDTDPEEIDGLALSEVKRVLGTQKDLQYLIDSKLREVLLDNYGVSISKGIVPRVETDEYSTLTVFSDLMGRRDDEVEFSTWLHAQPMHDITSEEQVEVGENVATLLEEAEEAEMEEVAAEDEEDQQATGQEVEQANTDVNNEAV